MVFKYLYWHTPYDVIVNILIIILENVAGDLEFQLKCFFNGA